MTTQEIIDQVRKLPLPQQREVIQTLIASSPFIENSARSEADIAAALLAAGAISDIPAAWNAPDEDFEVVEVKGKPLSVTLLEDRN